MLPAVRAVHQHRVTLVDTAGDLGVPASAEDGSRAGVGIHTSEIIRRQREATVLVVYRLRIVQEEGALGLVKPPLLTTENQGAET